MKHLSHSAAVEPSFLQHYLSPLERAAYRSHFQSFVYELEGMPLQLNAHAAKALHRCSQEHMAALRKILFKSKLHYLMQSDARICRFLLKPLEQHVLPTRIYHLLKQNRCRHMADVALLGESTLKSKRGMGKGMLTFLLNVFAENGCAMLFL